MCYIPNENDLSLQFVAYYSQLLSDGKDWMLSLRLSLEMFSFKLAENVGANEMFDFIDHSGVYMCCDGKFTFYQTK